MKHLILLRHGKTEAHHADGDFARALTDRGVKDSERMGRLIKGAIGKMDLVVSSPAVRGAQTARIVAKEIGYEGKIDWRPEIYGASLDVLLDIVRELPEGVMTALLVGHNPGFEVFVEALTQTELPDGHLPTAGLAHVTFEAPWSESALGLGTLAASYAPGSLR